MVSAFAGAAVSGAVVWLGGHTRLLLISLCVLLAGGLGFATAWAREARRENEAATTRLRSLLDSTGDAIFGVNPDGRIVVANPVAVELTGQRRRELRGRHLGELLDTSGVPGCEEGECLTTSVLETAQRRAVIEASIRSVGGQDPVTVDVTLAPVIHEGTLTGAVAVVRDVRERVLRDELLRASEERAWQVIETAADAFVEMDEDGHITLWNTAATELFGWLPEEVRGRRLSEVLIPEKHRQAHEEGVRRFLDSGVPRILGEQLELEALHRDGHEIRVELVPWHAPQADGSVRFDAFLRDITERSRAQEAVQESQRRLLQAEQVGGFGTWEFDVSTGEVAWSPGAYRVNDRDPETFVPSFEGWLETVHPEDRDLAAATVKEALAASDDYELEYRAVRRDGEIRCLFTVGTVERGEDGRPLRLLGTARDVTEERMLEQLKDEFTAIASHELRTPLTSIHGALSLIESGAFGELPGTASGLIEVATRNTERLVRLIDELLDVQRLTARKVSLRTQIVGLPWLLAEATSTMQGQARASEVALSVEAEEGVDVVVDPDRIVQVLTNVIGNAIRFSSPGDEVVVKGERNGAGVLIAVVDTGLGIPPDKTRRVFERFRQADTSDARERGGSGLGLTIAKELVELHGGSIRAESEGLGHGTRIVIDLPSSRVAGSGDQGTATVLVCDDNADLRFLTVERLQRLGFATVEAASGSEAVCLYGSVRPQIVLMDILLPDADGRDVIREIRALDGGTDAAVVVLSALDQPIDWQSCGADEWLTKPVDKDSLTECMQRLAEPRAAGRGARQE